MSICYYVLTDIPGHIGSKIDFVSDFTACIIIIELDNLMADPTINSVPDQNLKLSTEYFVKKLKEYIDTMGGKEKFMRYTIGKYAIFWIVVGSCYAMTSLNLMKFILLNMNLI